MSNAGKKAGLALLLLTGMWLYGQTEDAVVTSFSTGGHTVYQLRCTRRDADSPPLLIGAAYDGAVLCYTADGQNVWTNQDSAAFPYDLALCDIDGDGRDEVLVAAADGSLRALDDNGKLLWFFKREPPLLQVAATSDDDGKVSILTGGMEKVLYCLNADGTVRNELPSEFVVRHIRCGDVFGDGRTVAAVITAKNDRSRHELHLHDPATLKPRWEKPLPLTTTNPTKGTAFEVPWLGNRVAAFSFLLTDVNGDGCDEMLLSHGFSKKGVFSVYDRNRKKLFVSWKRGIRGKAYRMNLLCRARTGPAGQEAVLGLFGHQIVEYSLDGKIRGIHDSGYAFADGAYDDRTRTYFLGGAISGGDGIHAVRLDREGWGKSFSAIRPGGRIAEVEANLERLRRQVDEFVPPSYQPPPRPTLAVTGKDRKEINNLAKGHDFTNLEFVQFNLFTEDYDRSSLGAGWDRKRESRHRYNFSADQIVAFAEEREKAREAFALWAGHGNDPFYMQLETIRRIVEAAPTTLVALVFPEMTNTSDAMAYAVKKHIIPVAELCRKHGKAKVILRNKSVFWNANCYLGLWRATLLTGKNRDIFLPSMEETNDRCQALSLAGSTGLWLAGVFDGITARAVTDNANFCRFWEWGAQQVLHHMFRSLALRASLGADRFLVNIYQGDPGQLSVFYRMLDKGIIAIPNREALLSVSPICVGMREPAPEFVRHGNNGHATNTYEPGEPPMVFDRLDTYWAAAPTADHDLTRYGMGSERRQLDFLPRYPYGLLTMMPADTDLANTPHVTSMVQTDGLTFFDDEDKAVSPSEYRPRLEDALKKGARTLPVMVKGDVAWSVVRLDATHVRVMILDCGYLDPAERKATIVCQQLSPLSCRDILSREKLHLGGQSVPLTIPAGSLRLIDIEHTSAR
ncbi:MAG: hypothetical protein HOJ57_39830 [Lentisphaerae bacterium]|mgnify:CR=1 FL=1|nr:hypothetical protein [Lentisphaerota bacterium]MBT5612155.1 hypothetical protein [Lentisphaerota bacterium]MBT7058746.1 hypothetical protein [Lentisphaerota bacterium]